MTKASTSRSTYLCPHCEASSTTEVIDSRPTPQGFIRRRRHCNSCANRFTTFEVREEDFVSLDLRSETEKASIAFNNAVSQFNQLKRAISRAHKRSLP